MDLSALDRMSVPRLAGYLIVVGALAGAFSWFLLLLGHFAFEIGRPTGPSLLLAIPRGSFFALLVGFGLRLFRRRVRGGGAGERNRS